MATKEESAQRFGDELPYTIDVQLRGVKPFLFNRMDIDAYEQNGGPGSKKKARKRPEPETLVWRTDDGDLGYPAASLRASLAAAGKYFRSPIASSGSARNTIEDAVIPGEVEYGTFGVKEWDCIDFRHAKHGDMKRTPKPTYRPRLEVGWRYTAQLAVVIPELYGPALLAEILTRAGQVCGIGDGRKIGMGRFVLDGFEVDEGLPW